MKREDAEPRQAGTGAMPPRVTIEFGFGGIRSSWITHEEDAGEENIDGIHDGKAKKYLSEQEHTAIVEARVAEARAEAIKGAIDLVCLSNGKDHAIKVLEETWTEVKAAQSGREK